MNNLPVAVLPSCHSLIADYPSVNSYDEAQTKGFVYVVDNIDNAVSLVSLHTHSQPLSINFEEGHLGFRLAHGRARQEALVKAVLGKYAAHNTQVLDATAGLGRDSALLAASGCQVIMLERDSVLHALLQDALARASLLPFVQRMQLVNANAVDYLTSAQAGFDVVYLDPMFADHSSKAQVKKELAWMRDLLAVPSQQEEQQLLQLARQVAKRRVVVKRAAKAPCLGGVVPTASSKGKAIRFDIYTPAC